MERGLYIAASGMMSEMVRQDLIANDLANASTPGYKPDRATQREFAELLLANSSSGAPVGALGMGVAIDRRVTDLSPAAIRDTGEATDFAIEGDGFFAVRTDGGVRYTRNGQFSVSATGALVDSLGHQVLGPTGRPLAVAADGKIESAALGVFSLDGARKEGDSLLTGTARGKAAGTVRQGALEASGTDPVRAMVEMIASLRALEANQRVITTIDGTLTRAATQVASPNGG